jgi:hypothetical protein
MEAKASVSTNGEADDEQNPEQGELHAKDEHKANPEERRYTYSYADVVADLLSRFRFYLFLLLVIGVGAAWYYGLPRWSWLSGAALLLASGATWRYVFDYVSRLDEGLANIVLELFPEDGTDHHAYEVGDGALPDFDTEGVPAYPVRGVPDIFEVREFNVEDLTYRGPPRAALPYADYVDVELRGLYHREDVIPLLDEIPKLRARNAAETTARTTEKTVSNIELLEKALSGDLEPDRTPNPVLDEDEDLETHGSELAHERNGKVEKEAQDD